MKIEVISKVGLESAAEAWRLSRNHDRAVSVNEVFGVDVPVNEIPTAHILFEDCTIIEREIMAMPRKHVMWARTSHVDDPLKFSVPPVLSGSKDVAEDFVESCRAKMMAEKEQGKSQDEWRENLPIISHTSWTQRVSYRDLVKITSYFTYLLSVKSIPLDLRVRLQQFRSRLVAIINDFTGSSLMTNTALANFIWSKLLYEGDITISDDKSHQLETAGMIMLYIEVPIWLRAQIVRHRELLINDTFFKDVLARPDALTRTIAEPVKMEIAATKEFWKTVMSKRSCWLAQDELKGRKDPWQIMLDAMGFKESMLPCAHGACAYERDADLRLTPDDPGVPCPIHVGFRGLPISEEMRTQMRKAAQSRHPLWINRIEELSLA